MKIALVCSHGGHLTELLELKEAFNGHDVFFVTYEDERTKTLPFRAYRTANIGTSIRVMASSSVFILKILMKERPAMVISTGSEIAIPAIFFAKLMGIKTVFIESVCRVSSKSGTGKLVYWFSDVFLVQWPQLRDQYGRRAQYHGSIL
jgi:beta-1,4-N-acetylglucosaminyltransferase